MQSYWQLAGQWLCDGTINGWFEFLISKYENCYELSSAIAPKIQPNLTELDRFDLDRHPEVKIILPTIMVSFFLRCAVPARPVICCRAAC